jgi:hypothetical protein
VVLGSRRPPRPAKDSWHSWIVLQTRPERLVPHPPCYWRQRGLRLGSPFTHPSAVPRSGRRSPVQSDELSPWGLENQVLPEGLFAASAVDAEPPRRVVLNDSNQYCRRSGYRAVHTPAALLDTQETTDRRVPIPKNVPVLRIDHIPIQGTLFGVWRGKRLRVVGVLTVKK